MSEVVKKAYESKKALEERGIHVNPEKGEIKIGLKILQSNNWIKYRNPLKLQDVQTVKEGISLSLLDSLIFYLLDEGYEIEAKEDEEFYELKIKKGSIPLFKIVKRKLENYIVRGPFISPWDDLCIEEFNYNKDALFALDLILSNPLVEVFNKLYKKYPRQSMGN